MWNVSAAADYARKAMPMSRFWYAGETKKNDCRPARKFLLNIWASLTTYLVLNTFAQMAYHGHSQRRNCTENLAAIPNDKNLSYWYTMGPLFAELGKIFIPAHQLFSWDFLLQQYSEVHNSTTLKAKSMPGRGGGGHCFFLHLSLCMLLDAFVMSVVLIWYLFIFSVYCLLLLLEFD